MKTKRNKGKLYKNNKTKIYKKKNHVNEFKELRCAPRNDNSKKILGVSCYNDDDLNWLGILKTTSIINQINKKNYDALVDLNPGYERLISLICLKLSIPIKIGFQSPLADNLYTLILQATENSFLEKHYKILENLLSLNQE